MVQIWLGRIRRVAAQPALRRRLRLVFGLLSLLAVGYVLVAGLGRVDWAALTIDWRYLVLAWLATVATVGMGVLSWTALAWAILPGIPAKQLAHIHVRSLLAKYLPGGFWNSASKVVLLNQLSVPAKRAGLVVVLEMGLLALTGLEVLLVMANAFPYVIPWQNISPTFLITSLIVITTVCVLCPLIISRTTYRDQNPALITALRELISTSFLTQIWKAELIYVLNWLCLCGCFSLIVAAIMPLDINRVLTVSFATISSFLISLAVIVIPNGVGLRELSYSFFMSSIMPAAIAASLGFVFRLVIALAEVFAVMVVSVAQKLHNARIRRRKRPLTPMEY